MDQALRTKFIEVTNLIDTDLVEAGFLPGEEDQFEKHELFEQWLKIFNELKETDEEWALEYLGL